MLLQFVEFVKDKAQGIFTAGRVRGQLSMEVGVRSLPGVLHGFRQQGEKFLGALNAGEMVTGFVVHDGASTRKCACPLPDASFASF